MCELPSYCLPIAYKNPSSERRVAAKMLQASRRDRNSPTNCPPSQPLGMQNGQTTPSLAFASPKDSFIGDHQFSPQNHLPGHPWFDPIEICCRRRPWS